MIAQFEAKKTVENAVVYALFAVVIVTVLSIKFFL